MPEKNNIAIIGRGNVGSAMKKGLEGLGHDVHMVGNEPDQVKKVSEDAEIVFLAVPFDARKDAIEEAGVNNLKDVILVDVTNSMGADGALAIDPRKESGAEQVREWAKGARVVKAFNTIFAEKMAEGQVNGEPLSVFVASDDDQARERVMEIARDIGFDPVDAGNLENSRWLECLAMLNISLGYQVKHGTDIGFRLVRASAAQGGKKEERVAERR